MLPQNVAFETSNFCNRACAFCPVSVEPKPRARLSESLFLRVLVQLERAEYAGDICFNWYNEPLADKRLPWFITQARRACPQSHIYFATNGDFLDVAEFDRLVRVGVSLVRVSQYDGGVSPHVQAILDRGRDLDRICVSVKGPDELTNTRGGIVGKIAEPLRRTCSRPVEQLIVSATGDVPLCCNDYRVSVKVGNVADTSILDLWHSPAMRAARQALQCGDRTRYAVCRECNEPGEDVA